MDFITEEIEKLAIASHEAKRQIRRPFQIPKPLMQRVPRVLIDMKEDLKRYFEPRMVALGPLHHGKPKLEKAEHTKRKLAALFLDENTTTPPVLFNKIKAEIKHLRKCYKQEDIQDYDNEKLAWMFFVDGSAVLYAIRYGLRGEFKMFFAQLDLFLLDLFLLENQLPYRVLEILIGSAKEPKKWEKSITEFVGDKLLTSIGDEQKSPDTKQEEKQDYAHLLEHMREKLLAGENDKSNNGMLGKLLLSCGDNRKHKKTYRGIKALEEIGIYVKPSKRSNSLRNISFSCNFHGSLRMPRIRVDYSTASKLLNLVALEMCPDFDNDFAVTTYLCFLDSLINTAEDVKELRVKGVLHNYFETNEEVAHLFNRNSRDLVPDEGMYNDVIDNILKYCNNPLTVVLAQAYTCFRSPSALPRTCLLPNKVVSGSL